MEYTRVGPGKGRTITTVRERERGKAEGEEAGSKRVNGPAREQRKGKVRSMGADAAAAAAPAVPPSSFSNPAWFA
jgi:hypothetical protein